MLGLRWGVNGISRTAECVGPGHPDKYLDRVADRILDGLMTGEQKLAADDPAKWRTRAAIEGVAKDNLLVLMGEVTAKPECWPDVRVAAQDVWRETGYGSGEELSVLNYFRQQSPDIDKGTGAHGGAGDQGVMVGYATDENEQMLPLEYLLSRQLIQRLSHCRRAPEGEAHSLPWMLSDAKSQVTLDANGHVTRLVIAIQHADICAVVEEIDDHMTPGQKAKVFKESGRQQILEQVVQPVIGAHIGENKPNITINGTGIFIIGGPPGDAGEVGRKIVVDAYGPRVPVGGGAYSGKDPTKVDRSAAYMARKIAKSVVTSKVRGAKECLVHIAYAIGALQPEMVTAVTDQGEDVWPLIKDKFSLAPWDIIHNLGLWQPDGWCYYDTATNGHYGHSNYPWEQPESL